MSSLMRLRRKRKRVRNSKVKPVKVKKVELGENGNPSGKRRKQVRL